MRRPVVSYAFTTLVLLGASCASQAQETSSDPVQFVPRVNLSLGYQFLHANAPPGNPQKFNLNGGYASLGIKYKYWLSFAGEFTGTHANNISALGQNLFLTTYTAGPRITFRRRYTVPFAQATFGAAHGSDSYFPTATSYTTSANTFALTAGGGLDLEFTHGLAIRAIQAQYLHTGFNNGVNTSQNQLMLGAGVVFKFHGRYAMPHAPRAMPAPPPPSVGSLECSANVLNVEAGQLLEVSAAAHPQPAGTDLMYSWTATGGSVTPQNNRASIDTGGLSPGMYTVNGHAAVASGPTAASQCEVHFRVLEPRRMTPPIILGVATAPPVLPPSMKQQDSEFHEHVKDAYFDYEKAEIRSDTLQAIREAAAYLQAHSDLRVLVGGYSDERGTPEYNLALGEKRADAARDALMQAGVDASRITVVSYGKGVQVCTRPAEPCYQQNRRAAFMLQP